MKLGASLLLLALSARAFPPPAAAEERGFDAGTVDRGKVDRIMEAALEAWGVPGASLALVKEDRILYLKGYGVREAGKEGPVTPETRFALASTSKAFATTAMAMLVTDGKMAWDDPVRQHLPSFHLSDPLADSQVTLRDLVTHRTGLGRHDMLWLGSPWGREELLRKVAFLPLDRPFRSGYGYNNVCFMAAGEAVGAASGGSWEAFVRGRIFEPLGMAGAGFSTHEVERETDRATPHVRGEAGKAQPIRWRNLDNLGAAGSLYAGARDLAPWMRFHLGDGTWEGRRLASAAALRETHTPQTVVRLTPGAIHDAEETTQASYGMGWLIWDYRGKAVWSHSGLIGGFRARVTLLPKEKLGIAILANLGGTPLPEAATNAVADQLLALPPRDWNGLFKAEREKEDAEAKERERQAAAKRRADTKPSRELEAYAGEYRHPAYGEAVVGLQDGSLRLRWSSADTRLEHYHFDRFTAKESLLAGTSVQFTLGADGEVAALTLLSQQFRRKEGVSADGAPK